MNFSSYLGGQKKKHSSKTSQKIFTCSYGLAQRYGIPPMHMGACHDFSGLDQEKAWNNKIV
jgi:hypothetical protein